MVSAPEPGTQPASSLDAGRLLFGLGGIVLLVSLFLDWYGDDIDAVSAWTAFEIVDLLLATIALAALAWAAGEMAPRRVPRVYPGAAGSIAVAALAMVVVSLIDPPPALFNADPKVGAWMALGATLAMLVGAFLSTTAVSITVARRDSARTVVADPDAETETYRSR